MITVKEISYRYDKRNDEVLQGHCRHDEYPACHEIVDYTDADGDAVWCYVSELTHEIH